MTSILGSIAFEQAYYHCSAGGHGFYPGAPANRAGRARVTAGCAELISQAGVVVPFGEAATKILPRLSGVKVSESTVERVVEAVGDDVGQRLAAGETFGPAVPWDWYQDAEGKTVGYVQADATGVPQQGSNGAKAEGKMVHLGAVLNPAPGDWKGKRPPMEARYVSSLSVLADLQAPLRLQAGQVGLDAAQRWIAITDGGAGLEDFMHTGFPRVECVILDYWHAVEHFSDFVRIDVRGNEADHKTKLGAWKETLLERGGGAALAELEALEVGAHATAAHADLLGYVRNQVDRMDYPTYRGKGWHIGSGAIESACKNVINRRLKGAGMRWGKKQSAQVSHLRCLYRSEPSQWQHYWNPQAIAA